MGIKKGDWVRVISNLTHGEIHPTRKRLWMFPAELRYGDCVRVDDLTPKGNPIFLQSNGTYNHLNSGEYMPIDPPPDPTKHRRGSVVTSLIFTLLLVSAAAFPPLRSKIMDLTQIDLSSSPLLRQAIENAAACVAYAVSGWIALGVVGKIGGMLAKYGEYSRKVAEWKLEDTIKRRRVSDEESVRRNAIEREEEAIRRKEADERKWRDEARLVERLVPHLSRVIQASTPNSTPVVEMPESDRPSVPPVRKPVVAGKWARFIKNPSNLPSIFMPLTDGTVKKRTAQAGDLVMIKSVLSTGWVTYCHSVDKDQTARIDELEGAYL